VTAQAGVGGGGWSTGALFIDYDRDGLLDLFVARYLKWDFSMDIWCGERKPGFRAYCHPDQFQPVTYLVFHNEGNGRFKDVSAQTHIAQCPGNGLGIAMNDFDRDGWPDVFVANDAVSQQLFRNRGDGSFEEIAVDKGVAYDSDWRQRRPKEWLFPAASKQGHVSPDSVRKVFRKALAAAHIHKPLFTLALLRGWLRFLK